MDPGVPQSLHVCHKEDLTEIRISRSFKEESSRLLINRNGSLAMHIGYRHVGIYRHIGICLHIGI